MFTGQILIYWYNGLHNSKENDKRNVHVLQPVIVKTGAEFKEVVKETLDSVPPGKGYILVKYNNKVYIIERDKNDPTVEYVRHELKYHPLLDKFTI